MFLKHKLIQNSVWLFNPPPPPPPQYVGMGHNSTDTSLSGWQFWRRWMRVCLWAWLVVSTSVLGSAGGQIEVGGWGGGSRGSTLQTLASHHILKSFSSQVLSSFTNSCCFIRAKLAHVRQTALRISIFNTVWLVSLKIKFKKIKCCKFDLFIVSRSTFS